MPDRNISESLRLFIEAHINSIEEVEVLILLRATEEREWSAAQISRELGASVSWIQERLDDLASKGFLVVQQADSAPLYRFAPSSQESRAQIEDLAITYKQRRLRVISLVYAKPENTKPESSKPESSRPESSKPESDVLSFSNAFRITKKKGGE
jgi:DNA-binding HxlR family transcriptional regulator